MDQKQRQRQQEKLQGIGGLRMSKCVPVLLAVMAMVIAM